jgi:hypothetical protein
MTIRSLRRLALLPLLALLTLVACDSNDPEDEIIDEEEVITLVRLNFTPEQASRDTLSFEARFDEARTLLSVDTLRLSSGITYNASVDLLNTLESPAEDISAEVREEAETHRFFYTLEGEAEPFITLFGFDADANSDPLGLTFKVQIVDRIGGGVTSFGKTGTMAVKLRHYEEDANLPTDKRADRDTSPDVPGIVSTDVDVTFPIRFAEQL